VCRNVLKFDWDMARAETGEVLSLGCNYLIVTSDGRISADYQFPIPRRRPIDTG
jgi:hypothetical protein